MITEDDREPQETTGDHRTTGDHIGQDFDIKIQGTKHDHFELREKPENLIVLSQA